MAENTLWIPKVNRWFLLAPLMISSFLFMLNETIANVALPYMAGSFSISHEESIWILTSYLVSSSILISCVDFFSKLMGRKNFLIACIALFTFASFLCGFSHSLGMIVLARILQGIGGGPILPITQAILLELFDEHERAVPIAMFGGVVVLAPILGPVIGGWLTLNWNWSWIFYINIPFGILACILGLKYLEDPDYAAKESGVKVDAFGFVFLALFIATLQIILDKGNNADWFGSTWVCWFALICGASFISFLIRELTAKEPLCDLSVFLNKNFVIGTFSQFIIYAVLLASMALLPQFLQMLMGYDSLLSGLAMMPRGLGATMGLVIYGAFSNKIDNRILVIIGLLFLGFAGIDLENLNLSISSMSIAIPNFMYGAGMALSLIPLITLSCNTLHNSQMTNASGLQSLFRNIGGAMGTSISATAISRFSQIHQTYLVDNLSQFNNIYLIKTGSLSALFGQYTDKFLSNYMADSMLYNMLIQQSTLKSFISVFEIFAIASFVIIPLVFMISNKKA